MISIARTPFAAVFRAELLYNSKRGAPYALLALFSANAVLWWGGGPASHFGWATNSDFYIARNFGGFSFLTLPLFNALLMGDPVVRDYRHGIDPLILSKPVRRAEYLLGKFLGNFFVLFCCMAGFALTLAALQAIHPAGMVVLPARLFPYVKHFLFFVVVSHLALAALCFTVGTLSRNVKLVYGLVTSSYVLYLAWQLFLKNFSPRWRVLLDPLLFNVGADASRGRSAEWLDQLTISYSADMFANRALMLLVAAACLAVLYFRFSRTERSRNDGGAGRMTLLNLAPEAETIHAGDETFDAGRDGLDHESFDRARSDDVRAAPPSAPRAARKHAALPAVGTECAGARASLKQLGAALSVECRLLREERGLVVLLPLAALLCTLGVTYFGVAPPASYSALYAGRTAESLLLFLFGVALFYTGEGVHRDRELRVEPVLWGFPAPDYVFLLSKFLAVLLLSLTLIALVGLCAVALQIIKGHGPLELRPYLLTYSVILLPTAAFMVAAAIALNVLLRDKYVAYAAGLGTGGGLFYLYGQGYKHWLYNPALYELWTYRDLSTAGGTQTRILTHRLYCLALTALLLSLAHLFFARESTRGLRANGRPTGKAWAALLALASAALALVTGSLINV
ncbi:MAG TPA: ABC transporter permease [Pyrinomonadaceae bacterium]|nr:ABC transporter permease [Pyrinomonadaceae bacterium]